MAREKERAKAKTGSFKKKIKKTLKKVFTIIEKSPIKNGVLVSKNA